MRLARRPALLALLLIALVTFSGLIAREAWSSGKKRRALADQAMHEYAGYAAAKYRDNVQSWLYTALDELFALAWVRVKDHPTTGAGAPALQESARALDGCECGPMIRALYYFDFPLDTTLHPAAPATGARAEITPTTAELRWLVDTIAANTRVAAANRGWLRQRYLTLGVAHNYATVYASYGDRLTVIVYTLRHDRQGRLVGAYGMVTDAQRFVEPFFDPLYRARVVLPPVAGKWLPSDSLFSVAAFDSLGRALFASPVQYSSPLGAVVNMDPPLGHLRIRFAVNPSAEDAILVGGLPQSRAPLLLGALAITAILSVFTLLQVRAEVERARQRASFAASVSHELRTPLAQILLFAETVKLGRATSAERRAHAVDVIIREAHRLMTLVDNILHVSRSDRVVTPVSLEWIFPGYVVGEIIAEFAPLANEAGSSIYLEPIDAGIVVNAEKGALRQMLLNVLDNAVKYGKKGQEIQVGARLTGTTVRISVDDEGPGIQRGDRAKIWKPFVRLARSARPGVAGAGIGLAVVHELATAQGGRAWVEEGTRGGVGGGARFVMELPGGLSDDYGEVTPPAQPANASGG